MAKRKSKHIFDKFGETFKQLKCINCSSVVPKVDIHADTVLCWECTMKSLTNKRK